MKKLINYFDKFQWGLLLSLLFVNLITGAFADPVGAICSLTGVLCVILVAKGSVANYYWGIVNVGLYTFLAFNAQLYGDFMLNAFYYFPLQFVGIYMWKKHTNSDGDIEAKVMTKEQKIKLAIGSVLSVAIYSVFLSFLGGNVPLIDATSTVFSVIAMILMLKMYAEQWLLWIVVNCVSVVMWIFPLMQGEQGAMAMVLMWSAYLANAIYGYINWKKMAQ